MAQFFASGSLMGDALLARHRAQPARLPGYHRAFLHRSLRRWGQPAAPCPILGLAAGGECWGLLFDVPAAEERAAISAVEKREGSDERRRERRRVETADGVREAWVWLSRAEDGAGSPALEALETRLRAAHGTVGTGVEYVRAVVHAIELHGLHDPFIESLWQRLRA